MEEFGKIYKITNSDNDFVYVGKTVDSLSNRLSKHERDYGGWLSRGCRKDYLSSFELFRFTNYKIELVETVSDKSILYEREKYYINLIRCINIQHNNNLSSPSFVCPCGEVVDSTIRYKHNKSPRHRKSLRELHSKSNFRHQFIKMYKDFKIDTTPEIVGGITLNIDC
jgi:hypothetical protein